MGHGGGPGVYQPMQAPPMFQRFQVDEADRLIGVATVDGRNPKQPPEMYKTLQKKKGYFAYQLVSRISSINSRTNPGKEATFKRRAHHCIHDRNGARSHEEILLIFAWLNHLYPEGTIAGSRKIVDISHRNSSQLGNLTTSTGG